MLLERHVGQMYTVRCLYCLGALSGFDTCLMQFNDGSAGSYGGAGGAAGAVDENDDGKQLPV